MKKSKLNSYQYNDLFQILITIIFISCLYIFVLAPVRVVGDSMEDTVSDNQRLMAMKILKPSRFDVVTLKSPIEPEKYLIKRVIGLPGEKIQYKNNQLYVDAKPIEENFLNKKRHPTQDFSIDLQNDSYLVLGDNREISLDSRTFGPVAEDKIKAVTLLRYYPFDTIKWFK